MISDGELSEQGIDSRYLQDDDEGEDYVEVADRGKNRMSLSELLSQQESRPSTASMSNAKRGSRPSTSSGVHKTDFGTLTRELAEELANM